MVISEKSIQLSTANLNGYIRKECIHGNVKRRLYRKEWLYQQPFQYCDKSRDEDCIEALSVTIIGQLNF